MHLQSDDERLLNRIEAADFLRVKPSTLAVWDCLKRHDLKPRKIGRLVRYRLGDLKAFAERQLIR